jgi:hypothetical protein
LRRALLAIGLALAVGVAAGQILSAPTSAEDPSDRIISGLKGAAANGDARAKRTLVDLSAYLARVGLDPATITAQSLNDARSLQSAHLSATGLTPFWLDVVETADLSSISALRAYLLERRTAASSLAGSNSHRGRLSMAGFVDLNRLCDLRDLAGATVLDADVDVWLGNTWVTRFGFGPDAPGFWYGSCDEIAARIRDQLASAHADDRLGAQIRIARFTIFGATLLVPTGGVSTLLVDHDVLLFDPEEDLLAPWANAAAHVRLIRSVDVFGAFVDEQVRGGHLSDPFVPGALSSTKEVAP